MDHFLMYLFMKHIIYYDSVINTHFKAGYDMLCFCFYMSHKLIYIPNSYIKNIIILKLKRKEI